MIEVTIPGIEKLAASLRGLGPELRRELHNGVVRAAGVVRDEAAQRIHSPGGHAAKGLVVKTKGSGIDMIARIGPGKGRAGQAAIFAQRGRGANTTPPSMKVARSIARRYGIPRDKARGLAIMIGRRGTTGHPVMREALAATRGQVETLFQAAFASVVRKVLGR